MSKSKSVLFFNIGWTPPPPLFEQYQKKLQIWKRDTSLRLWGTLSNKAKYAYLGAYLGYPNMVKWGIREKILQNVAQTHWPWVNRTAQSKVKIESHFAWFLHFNYNVRRTGCGITRWIYFSAIFLFLLPLIDNLQLLKQLQVFLRTFWFFEPHYWLMVPSDISI